MIDKEQFIFPVNSYNFPEGWYEHFHFIENFWDHEEREMYVWLHKNTKDEFKIFIGRHKHPDPALLKIWFENKNDLIMFKLTYGGGSS